MSTAGTNSAPLMHLMKVPAGKIKKMASVLIVVENLPVPLDRRVWQEALALRDLGYDVAVVCPKMRGYTEPFEILEGIRIYRHWITGEAGGMIGFAAEYSSALIGEALCIFKAWRHTPFDVIHLCNPPDILFLNALPYKLLAKTRVVFDVHDIWPEMFEAKYGTKNIIYHAVRLAERCTLALADVVIATNESVLSSVTSRGNLGADSTFVVRTSPNAINTSAKTVPERKNNRKFLVGYIGVMGSADGLEYLLRAIEHIVKTIGRNDISFCLMGSGAEWENLTKLRNSLEIQDFTEMPGRVSDEYLAETLATMDLGVACDPINSYNDHCTMNKTLEYMAFGKAQVMFGIKEGRISAGQAASYVDENSPELLALEICHLLDNPELRQEMGRIGVDRIQGSLSWRNSVKNLEQAYALALR